MKTYRGFFIPILLSLLLIVSCKENKPPQLNLDFEQVSLTDEKPVGWLINESGCQVSLDKEVVYNGKYSLKIASGSDQKSLNNNAVVSMKYENVQNKQKIRLTGFIKNENTTSDSNGLFIRYNNSDYSQAIILKSKNFIGTHDWQEYSIEITIDSKPNHLLNGFDFGIQMNGTGKIWADNLKLFIDGEQIYSLTTSTNNFEANSKEINWLKTHVVRIKTVKAGNGFEDLEPLKKIIGDARIVGLGENTHGSSEVFQMKHRLVEFLASEMGFTIFSIEANMPEAYRINDYVLYGVGDAKKLLKGMYFWTWNTQEVLNMIEWMKKYNISHKDKIQFTGFDMQVTLVAVENIKNYSKKYDRSIKSKIDSISALFDKLKLKRLQNIESMDTIVNIKSKCAQLLSYFFENKFKISKVINITEYNWLIQNVNILVQNIKLVEKSDTGYNYRDECMAKNIEWILENNPKVKIVLWAHNEHISKQEGAMGGYLSKKYGDNYFNIGFLSNSGTYTASNYNSHSITSNNILIEGKPGSFEYSFHKIGIPFFLFNFDQVYDNQPEREWLTKSLNFRSIGAIATQNQFSHTQISKMFNAIIYLDSTHASKCFDVK